MQTGKSFNYKILRIFAPILISIGILGFITPASISLTSGAIPYNLFHLTFGFIGLLSLFTGKERYIRGFNIGFGLIDLYQAFASFLNLFPKEIFKWTRVDDILHIVIGAALVIIGLYGFKNKT
jgi:hypothetical protein